MNNKVWLIILDGRWLTEDNTHSAIAQAHTPTFDHLRASCPHTTLEASGEAVWLPVGQMGNSEVWHMHIGAGTVIYQDFVKISKSVSENNLKDNPELIKAIEYAKINGSRIHIMWLLSDGGVHAHDTHIHGLCRALAHHGVTDFAVHAWTDGRDTAPTSWRWYVADLLPDHPTMVVLSLVMMIFSADPNILTSALSHEIPISSLMIVAPVTTAMSLRFSFLVSPNHGALTGMTLSTHLILFTTSVVRASPSTSSAIITISLLPLLTSHSMSGRISLMFDIFLSVIRTAALSAITSIRAASVTKYGDR